MRSIGRIVDHRRTLLSTEQFVSAGEAKARTVSDAKGTASKSRLVIGPRPKIVLFRYVCWISNSIDRRQQGTMNVRLGKGGRHSELFETLAELA